MNSSSKDKPIIHMLNTHSDLSPHPSRFVTPDGQSRGALRGSMVLLQQEGQEMRLRI